MKCKCKKADLKEFFKSIGDTTQSEDLSQPLFSQLNNNESSTGVNINSQVSLKKELVKSSENLEEETEEIVKINLVKIVE